MFQAELDGGMKLNEWWNCFKLSASCNHTPKISSMYLTQKAGDLLAVAQYLVSRLCINSMANGGASLLPIATPIFCQ